MYKEQFSVEGPGQQFIERCKKVVEKAIALEGRVVWRSPMIPVTLPGRKVKGVALATVCGYITATRISILKDLPDLTY